ncbi:precorrin-2 dehydrogenase/sirohydrochlorin ferrochelatase family protein [Loigolactobacillus coryniformis]|uniref:precorrin-2 dehydrogenase n=1 Tax=Loigolactobacillus coryniformis subsp. torquens DSM 20004 = KCTC 3535 TaxID=1423822 RepID=A0A2D1KLX6_9LACO|nr:bifunctional precorrin-2 dehydrogenase/sirohydrochlorin ferrochelatase [Loigolactobacillus coryniformis]ATO43150.1 siroheme synthase [Loigolactobacillus coryniformis subsp. torquens DSM 20004 = KCTC 3535]KRK84777.1 siroheme synthase [Loigolactobacillus coryniformis subsp. torquens DSM 20004 = KCTC 3535]
MYPVMLNLQDKQVIVVGGGRVAARKIKMLQATGAVITVISPTLAPTIDRQQLNWVARAYQTGDLAQADLIIACTDDLAVNAQVRHDAGPGQLVNNTSNKYASDFYNMAMVSQDDVALAVSTHGSSPKLAKKIRQLLTIWLQAKPWRKGRNETK